MHVQRPSLRVLEGGNRPRPRLAHALELAALGIGLVAVISVLAATPSWFLHLGTFQGLFALAFVFYGLAVLGIRRYAALPHAAAIMLAVAVAARGVLLPVPPSLSGDVHRYVWEGRVLLAGGNPYRQAPDDPALEALRDRVVWPQVNHPDLSTIYPPLAEAGFALVAWISPTVLAFKVWVVLHDLALVLVLMRLLRRHGQAPFAAVAYAWNPLVLVEYAGTGHNDPTAMLWLAVALLLAGRNPVGSALALSAGALVKIAPLLALPFLWRGWTWRARWIAVGLTGAGLAAFAALTRVPASGTMAYWTRWRNNELLFHYVENWLQDFDLARAFTTAAVAAVILALLLRRDATIPAARFTTRAATLLSPVVHPWYLGWVLLFEPLRPSAPWLVLSCTAVLSYGVLATPAEGRGFHLPLGWRWVEYGLPLLVAIAIGVARRMRRTRNQAP